MRFRFSHNWMEIPWVKCMGLGKIRTDNAQWLLIFQPIRMPGGVSLAICSSSFKLVKSLADKTMLLTMRCHQNLKGVECVFGQWNWQTEQASGASGHCSYWNILFVHLEMSNQESFCIWEIFARRVLSGWVWLQSHVKQSHFLLLTQRIVDKPGKLWLLKLFALCCVAHFCRF